MSTKAYAKIYYQINKLKFAQKYWEQRDELREKREKAKVGTFKPPTKIRVHRRNFDVVQATK